MCTGPGASAGDRGRGVRGMQELTGLDARFLYSETPTAHMHTIKVAVVDVRDRAVELTPQLFRSLLESRLDRMPPLRWRVVPVPHRLGLPVWVEDSAFDLDRHIRWRTARAPGGSRELAAIISEISGSPLDRDRPLWELTVVDGLADHEIAFVVKLHHALADGGAAVALLENAFVIDVDSAIVQSARPEPLPTNGALYRQAAQSQARRLAQLPRFARESVHGLRAARREDREATMPLPRPFSSSRTPVNVSLTPERTFAMTPLPLRDVRAVKQAFGATFNDVFLAVCGGALRRYLLRGHELPRKGLLAAVPLGTRVGERRLSGNHVDNLILSLHTEMSDPVLRLRAVHDMTRAARRVRTALGTEMFEYRAGLTPLHLYPLGVRLWGRTHLADRLRPPVNLIASNVAGPRSRLELDGGVVTRLWSVGPILEGIGLNITAWSYADALDVSVLGCPASLPDPWVLTADLEAALGELRSRVDTA